MFSIASAIAAVFGFLRDLLGGKRRQEDRQAGRDEAVLKGNQEADAAIAAANQARADVRDNIARNPDGLRDDDPDRRPD